MEEACELDSLDHRPGHYHIDADRVLQRRAAAEEGVMTA